jgi:uncharacterized protein YggU (UPF0235/DUF167 family)
MLIRVYETPDAREASVTKVSEDYFEARVDERALGGRAYKRFAEILAEHFNIPKIENLNPKRKKNKKQDGPNILDRSLY